MQTSTVPTEPELRSFGLIMGGAIALIFGVAVPWLWDATWRAWPWLVAAALVGVALTSPRLLKRLYAAWMRIGHVLNWLISRVTLALVYYVVVVPMGAVMRLFKHDPLRRRFEQDAESYRVPAPAPDRQHLERPF